MKKSYLLFPLLLLFCLPAFAKIFRVGYNGIPLKGVDYTSITEANDSAKAGDTIQIYGSFSGGTINKRLVILGFGYNLIAHPGLQSNPGMQSNATDGLSQINYLNFAAGSDSSITEGCYLYACSIGSNKVIIRRCTGNVYLNNYEYGVNDLKIYSCSNLSVNMNYQINLPTYGYPCKNIQIYNSIGSYLTLYGNESNGSIINCVNSYPNAENARILIKNSIGSYQVGGNNIWNNNVFSNSEPTPALPGMNNKYAQVYDSIFVAPNPDPSIGSLDENNYQLRPNSPAKNFGLNLSGNPTDCGIFGGELAYRYKIGGQPAIPAFYKLSAPTNSASSNPYNITVSVRSNN